MAPSPWTSCRHCPEAMTSTGLGWHWFALRTLTTWWAARHSLYSGWTMWGLLHVPHTMLFLFWHLSILVVYLHLHCTSFKLCSFVLFDILLKKTLSYWSIWIQNWVWVCSQFISRMPGTDLCQQSCTSNSSLIKISFIISTRFTHFTLQLGAVCSGLGLQLHCDGARLMNAAVALGTSPARLVQSCDSVTLCLNKSLGAPMGSVIAGSREFITR